MFLCLGLGAGQGSQDAGQQDAGQQDTRRIVVLPFNAAGSFEPYGLGLATGLQRSLNVVDGVYAPPVGDAFLFTRSLVGNESFSIDDIAAAFNAQVIVSGVVSGEGTTGEVLLNFAGPAYPQLENVPVNVNAANAQDVLTQIVNGVVSELELPVSGADRSELSQMAAQTPQLPSLSAVAEASLRLPGGNVSALATAAELDAGSSWVLSEYARLLALDGELEAALEAALEAVSANAQDAEALVTLGIVQQQLGDSETALATFEQALAINPVHAGALTGRGVAAGDEAALEAALNSYPRSVDTYLELARLQAQDSPQRALQTLRRGTTVAPEASSLHRAFIQEALALGDAGGALAYLRETIAAQDNPPATLYSLAALLPDDLQSDALSILSAGKERYPESVTISLAEARLLERAGDLAAAEANLQTAFAANPSLELANRLAIIQTRQGRLAEAQATLEGVAGTDENVQYNLGQLYLEAGENQAALDIFTQLALERPGDAEVQANYGVALGRVGQYDEALVALGQALELDPTLTAASAARSLIEQEQQVTGGAGAQTVASLEGEAARTFAEGREAFISQDYTAALSAFSRAREAQDEPLIAFYQGLSYYLAGRPREAVEPFERAAEGFPESDEVFNNAGLVQLNLGRLDLALEYLERATQLNAGNSEAQLNLGLTYFQLGRYPAAVERWEEAIAITPNIEDAIADLLAEARARSNP